MKPKFISTSDDSNAINHSKRGKRFSLITNCIFASMLFSAFIAGMQITSEGTFTLSQFIYFYFVAICGGIVTGIVMYIGDENILKISWFKVKPTDKELDNYYECRKKYSKQQVEGIDKQISDLSIEKQKHEANLA